jgi:HPt (histidine-containing phosphotransfer) domain-containing protein
MTAEGPGDGGDDDGTMTIDPAIWSELRLLGEPDGGDFLIELVDGFIDDTQRRLALLDDTIDAHDAAGTARLAHSLKGSSAQLGFQRLSATCASLERLALTGSLSGADGEVAQVRMRYQALRGALAVTLRPVLTPPPTPG